MNLGKAFVVVLVSGVAGCSSTQENAAIDASTDEPSEVVDGSTARDASDTSITSPPDGGPAPLKDAGDANTNDAGFYANCFRQFASNPNRPNYDPFSPVFNSRCSGTNHQDIRNVEKVVFLGDSVTEGTPPNLPTQYYRTLVSLNMATKFGILDIADCAKWGAHNDDLLGGKREIEDCFPSGVEPKRTLIVMTTGGNDISTWASQGLSAQEATAQADLAAQALRDAITWLRDPAHFPNGSFVVFGNVYEYTDATGDLLSCPAAPLAGLHNNWLQGAPAVVHFEEQYMKIATETRTDLVFLLENFCGHGYHHSDPHAPCYLGPGTPQWFDLSCIHPTPAGHAVIAKLVQDIVEE